MHILAYQPRLIGFVPCEWLALKDMELYRNCTKSQLTMAFVLKGQSQRLIILGWYLQNSCLFILLLQAIYYSFQ